RIEKLPVVDREGYLKGLITVKDIKKREQFPHACKDDLGRLRVGAAVGVGQDRIARVDALIEAGVDVIVIDTAHGHSKNVLRVVEEVKRHYPNIEVVGGNVATADATKALIDVGVDAVKVGIGPGASCTTRIIAGIGVPQITAIVNCSEAAARQNVPIIADGGVKYSGDIAKAIAAGAESVMIGSLLAGTAESPGEMILYEGQYYKVYRGMGSMGAMKEGSRDRYFQEGTREDDKLVPEGVEGRVAYRGPLHDTLHQMIGGLRSGMGYCGSGTVDEFRKRTKLIRVTEAGRRESHPHDMTLTKEAPNYSKG
ncbi:MAG: IMP dehydrogenase, partial [Gemmatimonadetes bacterium]|nr:IMP dehydrogenase [Gemmatimonadota bacterium]